MPPAAMSKKSGALVLYGTDSSPTVIAVLLTLKELKIAYEFRDVSPRRGDNTRSEYLEKNPSGFIPSLEDNGHFIGDSHAIMAFLVSKYGLSDSLYPRDLYRRARVDHLLHYENGELFVNCVRNIYRPLMMGEIEAVPEDRLIAIDAAYDTLERFLVDSQFMAGSEMTIADFSCVTSITCLYPLRPIDEERHPKLCDWLQRMRELPYWDEVMMNENTMSLFEFVGKKLSKM